MLKHIVCYDVFVHDHTYMVMCKSTKTFAKEQNMLCEQTKVNIEDLIATANRLCNNLDAMANNELKHCAELQQLFDNYSWEALRMVNNLKHVKEMI